MTPDTFVLIRCNGEDRRASYGESPEMKVAVQCAMFVAAGWLVLQPVLAVPEQRAHPSTVAAPASSVANPVPLAEAGPAREGSRTRTDDPAHAPAFSPGKADGTGDPALGGERHPLYRLTRSDTLEATFTFSPEFNQSLAIQPDGFVTLRGAGLVYAEGLTLPELQQALMKAYSVVLHDPEITLTLKDFQKPYFLASGEVGRPGKYELRGDLTVNEAVAIAGGFTQQARHSQVVLFRRVSAEMAEGRVLDLRKMLNSRSLKEDVRLRPGDFVYVPQSRISKIRRFVPTTSTNWYLNPLQF